MLNLPRLTREVPHSFNIATDDHEVEDADLEFRLQNCCACFTTYYIAEPRQPNVFPMFQKCLATFSLDSYLGKYKLPGSYS